MLVANSVAAQAAAPAFAGKAVVGPERRARALQVEPRRLYIEPHLLPLVADVNIVHASVLPPSERIAVHLELYGQDNPASITTQRLHVRAGTLWPVARIPSAKGAMTQVSLLADRRGRVKVEYRNESTQESMIVAGQHGVMLDRTESTTRGLELHGRAWHIAGGARAFSALVKRSDVGYTFDLGKIGGHWMRLDVRGSTLTGLSAVSEG